MRFGNCVFFGYFNNKVKIHKIHKTKFKVIKSSRRKAYNEILGTIKIEDCKKNIANKKIKQSVNGNTNTVYINPLNSLLFVLNELKRDKINLSKNFYVFTGSTVGVVPILGNGLYIGKIDSVGSVKAIIQ